MKQDRYSTCLGINACEIRAFAQIAVDAGEREIVLAIPATMLSGANVFDVERSKRRVVLMKPAVFTSMPCPFTDKLPHRLRHRAASTMSLASRRRTARNLLART